MAFTAFASTPAVEQAPRKRSFIALVLLLQRFWRADLLAGGLKG